MDFQSGDRMTKIRGLKHGSTDQLVQENVRRNADGTISCAITGGDSRCSFSLPKMKRFTFAQHFLLQHPKETEQKGFLEKVTRLVHERRVKQTGPSQSNLVSDFVVKTEQGYCCRIDVASKCSYVQEKQISVSKFARHFREAHLVLARKHGFFKQAVQDPEEGSNLDKSREIQRMMAISVPEGDPNEPKEDLFTRVRKHVTFRGDRSYCNISERTCKYSQQIFKAALFRKHFCSRHPVAAIKLGFYDGFERNAPQRPEEDSVSTCYGKRKKKHQLVEENVTFDATGVHCRISQNFCKYIQLSYSADNFMRHFRLVHPVEAYAKGMMFQHTRAKRRKRVVESSSSQSESSSGSEDEEEESTSEDPSCEVALETGDAFDESSWLNVPSDDPSEYCRLCFSVTQTGVQIFSGPRDSTSKLAALIAECTGIQMNARVDHPAAICHDCCAKLTDICRFRRLCETLNRVVKRDRTTDRSETPSIEPALESIVEPAAEHVFIKHDEDEPIKVVKKPPRPSSPPPLIPFSARAAENLTNHEKIQNDVVQMTEGCDEGMASGSTEVPAEDDDDQPYISLQDDWYCCKLCNQIQQKFDAMVDHLQSSHPELGFSKKPAKGGRNVSEFEEIILGGKPYYKCSDCDTLMLQKTNLARHWRNYHSGCGGNERTTKRLLCDIAGCQRSYMESRSLKQHFKLQHNITSPAELIIRVINCVAISNEQE